MAMRGPGLGQTDETDEANEAAKDEAPPLRPGVVTSPPGMRFVPGTGNTSMRWFFSAVWLVYLIAPVSNGNTAIMCDLARRNDFRWDAILGADLARDFKPQPAVYLAAADAFDLDPRECMMCASHSSDLEAAAANGLRTAFIARPQERPGLSESAPTTAVDVIADSTLDLAAKLDV